MIFNKLNKRLILIFVGSASLIWFLIRVIPKPSRVYYPCMKVAAPFASSFIIYLIGLLSSVFFFRRAVYKFRTVKYYIPAILILISSIIFIITLNFNKQKLLANSFANEQFNDPLGPNNPIGEARGIFPGRVVWVYNPDATNENCTNRNKDDAYFLDNNCDQNIVDDMFSRGILSLTGKETHSEAWDAIFKYFNINHNKGDIGYVEGETIFIKINAVSAWSGAEPDGEMPSWIGIEFDTSPHSILAMLRQLVNEAGVPEQYIYVGDPMADIWNHLYNKFYAEFPDINYVTKRNITDRMKLTPSTEPGIIYSDHETVMDQISQHYFFQSMMDADYLLNIPSMKGHRWAGFTFFAKNHFGSNTSDGSWQLHKGLMKPDDDPLRSGYKLYRVLVDIMGNKYLGGNTLLYFMDALWATSYEHQKPQKFQSAPFNNDWSSSLLFSLDPVAVESVGLDILQKEFTEEDLSADPPRYTYVQWDGVDDYLHQAADSSWWPEDIIYDPENDGTPIQSLGVHEHWNNVDSMQYSRNLGTGEGIELIKIFYNDSSQNPTNISQNQFNINSNQEIVIYNNFPNPFKEQTAVQYELTKDAFIQIKILSIEGRLIKTVLSEKQTSGIYSCIISEDDFGNNSTSGIYIYQIEVQTNTRKYSETRQIVLLK